MPKPVKKPVRKLKTPPKPRRPSDPNRAAHAILAEHMARVQDEPLPAPHPPLDFAAQYKAHMAKLGAKGGKVSGAKRMTNLTVEQRHEIALNAARRRWAKPPVKD